MGGLGLVIGIAALLGYREFGAMAVVVGYIGGIVAGLAFARNRNTGDEP